ncbi:hypothetical protein GQR58_017366 [Nymphon striatum]|nr:hypothetical protein GQR58_017366 [Nymphon striatum]
MSSNIKSEQSLQNLSVVFGVVFFTNSGASMFPTIQNDMKKKKYFVHVVILSFLATAAFILPISFLTYKYVEFDVLPNIISSFRQGIVQDIAYFVLGIHTLLAFSILINPVCQDFEELLGISKSKSQNVYNWFSIITIQLCNQLLCEIGYVGLQRHSPCSSYLGSWEIVLLQPLCDSRK